MYEKTKTGRRVHRGKEHCREKSCKRGRRRRVIGVREERCMREDKSTEVKGEVKVEKKERIKRRR